MHSVEHVGAQQHASRQPQHRFRQRQSRSFDEAAATINPRMPVATRNYVNRHGAMVYPICA